MTDRPAPRAPWVLSYPGLRRSGGYLGIALPFALVLGQTVSNAFVTGHLSLAIQPSISAYYYTSMRNILVGDLCAIAVFLIACKGYSRFDAILGDLAGLCAVGVAFFPTSCGLCPSSLVSVLHATFASLLFLDLALFCLVLFRQTGPANDPTPQKLARNRAYLVCGITIVACVLLTLVTSIPAVEHLHTGEDSLLWDSRLFWFESIAVLAFGFAWITKGGLILRDKGEPAMPSVTRDMSPRPYLP
jgi:hypothetical protein